MTKPKSPALGRGLEALFGNIENKTNDITQHSHIDAEIANIDIDKITPNPDQPRKEFDTDSLEELAMSIKENGVIVPITVNKKDDKYIIIAGERRYRASKMAGLKQIPAYIRLVTANEQMQMALIENIQREDLNALEIALSLQALLQQTGLTNEELGKRLGKSRSNVTNYVRLLKLPAEIQIFIREDKLSMGHARALLGLDNEKQQIDLARKIVEQSLSVRQVEALVNHTKQNDKDSSKKTIATKKNSSKPLPELHKDCLNRLTERLDTQISIKRSQRGKGYINIPFKNDEEFKRIMEVLNKE